MCWEGRLLLGVGFLDYLQCQSSPECLEYLRGLRVLGEDVKK